MDKNSLLVLISAILLTVVCISNGDFLPPRHLKVRGPPIGHPPLKFHNKRPRPPVRVHHIHLNHPPPSSHPVKYVSAGPPRKYKPNIPLKSHFNPSPPAHTHFIQPIIDNNEGAIHTIPAPNLGPNGDRPIPPPALVSSIAGAIKPYHENVIKLQHHHPITQTKFEGGYEVHEFNDYKEPSHAGLPYYAPDPDPSVPAPQVPVTRDPHSHPSNGKAPLDLILQQQLENHHGGARVSPSHGVSYHGDPNSQFLQAFQDQYKFPQQYDGDYHAQGTQHKVTAVAPDSAELDYDSGAEVRYSFGSAHRNQYQDDQDDAATEQESQEILEESAPTFGQRIKPKKKNN